jgi:hypothetical protein
MSANGSAATGSLRTVVLRPPSELESAEAHAVVEPGTYEVVDPDPGTRSRDSGSNGFGTTRPDALLEDEDAVGRYGLDLPEVMGTFRYRIGKDPTRRDRSPE